MFSCRITLRYLSLVVLMTLVSSALASEPSRILVVHNNTDATIVVKVMPRGSSTIREQEVPPNSMSSLYNFLDYGRNEVSFSAPYTRPAVSAISQVFYAQHGGTRTHVFDLFPRHFGKSVMFDSGERSVGQRDPYRESEHHCARGGILSGVGGDDKSYSARWEGPGRLAAFPYSYNDRPFLRFELNGKPWPNLHWGVLASSWKLVCLDSEPRKVCHYGGTLEGVGGDGKHYSENWDGYGEIETIPYEYKGIPFFHFKLNGRAWPNSSWGVSQATWKVTCRTVGTR